MAQNKLNKELKNLANDPMPQVRPQNWGAAFPRAWAISPGRLCPPPN